MSRKHRCCPFVKQSWIGLGFLILAIFFMAMLQLYPDSIPDYPEACQSLNDFGFNIIPQLNNEFSVAADVMVIVAIASFLVLTPFVLSNPQLVIRRWFFLLGSLYLFRGLVVIATRYPRLPFKMDKFLPSNPIVGALSILIGAKTTATDIMYSGHTVNFVLTASFVSRYTYYGVFSFFFWIFSVMGMLTLIATREHYTADVLVAFIVSKLAFWCYHLFFDSLYKRFWVSGLELTNTGDVHLTFPIELKDAHGQGLEIEKYMLSDDVIKPGVIRETGQVVEVLRMDPFNGMRSTVYNFLRWLDFE